MRQRSIIFKKTGNTQFYMRHEEVMIKPLIRGKLLDKFFLFKTTTCDGGATCTYKTATHFVKNSFGDTFDFRQEDLYDD